MEFEENINIIDLMTEKNKYNSHKTIYIYMYKYRLIIAFEFLFTTF